jgi:voltage-gated potassium channel
MKSAIVLFLKDAFKENNYGSQAYKVVNGLIVSLILISTIEIILSSEPSFKSYATYFYYVFAITSIIFLIELISRMYIKAKTDHEFRGFNAYMKYFLSFYNFIDIISILPFFIGFFGVDISPLWKALRVFRVFKILRHFPSMELLVNSLKSKKNILLISMQSIFFLVLLLSISLYYCEYKIANSQFTSISQALLWSLAKFIGDIGGYGDFVPLTILGKILATINGILGIAIFALPAGIIGSGFVEEIEKQVKEKKALQDITLVKDVFSKDHIAEVVRNKNKYDQKSVRRKYLTYNDLKYRLNLTDEDIVSIIAVQAGLRIRTLNVYTPDRIKSEKIVAEYYDDNTIYGTFINKNSYYTIISPLSNEQPFLGHFTHAISERLNANYISVEKFSKSDFNPQKVLDFIENKSYFDNDGPDAFNAFKQDINTIKSNTKIYIILGAKASKNHTYELLNGGKAGEKKLIVHNSSFNPVETLAKFSEDLNKKLMADKFSLGIHEDYGISSEYHLLHFLKDKMGGNVFQINVSANLLKEDNELYYKSIYVLSETIKENL